MGAARSIVKPYGDTLDDGEDAALVHAADRVERSGRRSGASARCEDGLGRQCKWSKAGASPRLFVFRRLREHAGRRSTPPRSGRRRPGARAVAWIKIDALHPRARRAQDQGRRRLHRHRRAHGRHRRDHEHEGLQGRLRPRAVQDVRGIQSRKPDLGRIARAFRERQCDRRRPRFADRDAEGQRRAQLHGARGAARSRRPPRARRCLSPADRA